MDDLIAFFNQVFYEEYTTTQTVVVDGFETVRERTNSSNYVYQSVQLPYESTTSTTTVSYRLKFDSCLAAFVVIYVLIICFRKFFRWVWGG